MTAPVDYALAAWMQRAGLSLGDIAHQWPGVSPKKCGEEIAAHRRDIARQARVRNGLRTAMLNRSKTGLPPSVARLQRLGKMIEGRASVGAGGTRS